MMAKMWKDKGVLKQQNEGLAWWNSEVHLGSYVVGDYSQIIPCGHIVEGFAYSQLKYSPL